MKNFILTIEYDGTDLHGWQVQKDKRTVQGEIEKALATMTQSSIRITGSGRTDAGVHAVKQVANFRCDTRLAPTDFLSGLNSLLPADIVIRSCDYAPIDFHARYDVRSKTYHYHILNRALPTALFRHRVWWIRKKLDIHAMQTALAAIVGMHDFKAFENTGSPRSHTIRTIYRAVVETAEGDYIVIKMTADGFLRNMVRNIVGTLVEVGLGKMTASDFRAILASKDRSNAGTTAPPQGLHLMHVDYSGRFKTAKIQPVEYT